jgi:hypothetical protein
MLIISMKKQNRFQPLKAMMGAWSHHDVFGKIAIVVDDDIDIRDSFQVEWALSFRMQPAEDVYVIKNTDPLTLDPSQPLGWRESQPADQASSCSVSTHQKHPFRPRRSWARYPNMLNGNIRYPTGRREFQKP